ncbi:hypothetical protein QBC35DRAFT_465424 [Podospora australis]|uniref:Ig-like domain-containing protein n=1 Tax=Podospora australis TaxID=1536484 RepID=A0AAN6WPJ6_9PEZI|nr:hypothetical protein QBC35DRAFT_465424 [Podospora australis]
MAMRLFLCSLLLGFPRMSSQTTSELKLLFPAPAEVTPLPVVSASLVAVNGVKTTYELDCLQVQRVTAVTVDDCRWFREAKVTAGGDPETMTLYVSRAGNDITIGVDQATTTVSSTLEGSLACTVSNSLYARCDGHFRSTYTVHYKVATMSRDAFYIVNGTRPFIANAPLPKSDLLGPRHNHCWI